MKLKKLIFTIFFCLASFGLAQAGDEDKAKNLEELKKDADDVLGHEKRCSFITERTEKKLKVATAVFAGIILSEKFLYPKFFSCKGRFIYYDRVPVGISKLIQSMVLPYFGAVLVSYPGFLCCFSPILINFIERSLKRKSTRVVTENNDS